MTVKASAIAAALVGTGSNYNLLPKDCASAVFLPRALDPLGAVMFGDNWTGREKYTAPPPSLPGVINVMSAEAPGEDIAVWYETPPRRVLEHADELLAKHRPDFKRPSRGSGLLSDPRPPRFTVPEWKAAQDINDALHETAVAALGRWHQLQAKFVELCEENIVQTVLRPIDGGQLSDPVSPHLWRFERYALRFVFSQMNPDHPFDDHFDRLRTHWIFVTRPSLRQATQRLRISERDDSSSYEQYTSESMELMKLVIKELQITHHNQPKKVEVEQAIERLAPELSPTRRASLASFIRLDEGTKGRNRRHAS